MISAAFFIPYIPFFFYCLFCFLSAYFCHTSRRFLTQVFFLFLSVSSSDTWIKPCPKQICEQIKKNNNCSHKYSQSENKSIISVCNRHDKLSSQTRNRKHALYGKTSRKQKRRCRTDIIQYRKPCVFLNA